MLVLTRLSLLLAFLLASGPVFAQQTQQMPPDLQAIRNTFADLVMAKVNMEVRALKAEAERDALQSKLDKFQEHKP